MKQKNGMNKIQFQGGKIDKVKLEMHRDCIFFKKIFKEKKISSKA